MQHLETHELERGLDTIRAAPADHGTVELIVCRPAVDERTVLETGELDLDVGLVGDTWTERGSGKTDDGGPHPDKQLTVMNARVIALLARIRDRWPLAGDQLYVDLDLSEENLPAGARLTIGAAVIEVTASPHTGCAKFRERYGSDAVRFVNTEQGKQLRLRGLNAKVVQPGVVRRGDLVDKI